MHSCRRAFCGRILTRRETILTAGRAGIGVAALGLSALNARSMPAVLRISGQPEAKHGAYCVRMDSRGTGAPDTTESGKVAVQIVVEVLKLENGQLRPVANSQVEFGCLHVCGCAAESGNRWALTDSAGKAEITLVVPASEPNITIESILHVREYRLKENTTLEFSAPVVFTGKEHHIITSQDECSLTARLMPAANGFAGSARITMVQDGAAR